MVNFILYIFSNIFFHATPISYNPSIHFLNLLILFRITVCCSLSQHTWVKRQGMSWTCRQSVTRLTHTDKHSHLQCSLEALVHITYISLNCGRKVLKETHTYANPWPSFLPINIVHACFKSLHSFIKILVH